MVNIRKLLEKVNKKYGGSEDAPLVFLSSESPILNVPRLKTGIFSLDLALGGGIPQGRVIRIFGPFSAGKTWSCLKIVRNNQHLCRSCWGTYLKDKKKKKCCATPEKFKTLWLDIEGVWENKWAVTQGVNLDQLYISRTEFAEQALDIAHACMAEQAFDLVILDSLAALSSMKEMDSSQEDTKVAVNARVLNEFMRKAVSDINKRKDTDHKTTLILINQVRYTISSYGDPEVLPGGRGQEFAASVDVRMERKKILTDKGSYVGPGADNSKTGLPVGALTSFRVPKNKTAPPNRTGEFTVWFDNHPAMEKKVGDIDCSEAVFEYGLRCGVIFKKKKEYMATDSDDKLMPLGTKKEIVQELLFHDTVLSSVIESAIITRLTQGDDDVREPAGEDTERVEPDGSGGDDGIISSV